MIRTSARAVAVALLLAVCSLSDPLAAQESVPTRCEEILLQSPQHTTARLGRCGEAASTDLLWHLDRIDQVGGNLDGHFNRSSRGAGVVVYVMDTGVMASHDEFVGSNGSRVIGGADVAQSVPFGASRCRSGNKALEPCYSSEAELSTVQHGTSVASLVAGRNVGVAPDAQIVSIRVMNEHGLGTTRTYLDGLEAIIRHAWSLTAPASHTSIVNISAWMLDRLTSSIDPASVVPYAAVEQKMRDMVAGVDANGQPDPNGRRFFFVVAANNLDGGCGPSGIVDRFPATLGRSVDGIVTVGGMTPANSAWRGSCRGGVEVLAPAQNVFSATITARDEYRGDSSRSGTSFAAPIISGIAALLLSEDPNLTPEALEARIASTPSRVVDPDQQLADGKVATSLPLPPRGSSPVAIASAVYGR